MPVAARAAPGGGQPVAAEPGQQLQRRAPLRAPHVPQRGGPRCHGRRKRVNSVAAS